MQALILFGFKKRKFSKSTTMVILFFWYLNLKPHNLHYSTPSPSHLALVLFPLLIWEFICISEHFNYMQWFYTWIRSREPGWSFFSTLTKVDLGKSCHFQMWKKCHQLWKKICNLDFSLSNMAIRVVKFSNGGYKIRTVFA